MLGFSGHFVAVSRKYSLGSDFHLVNWVAEKTLHLKVELRLGHSKCLLSTKPFIFIVMIRSADALWLVLNPYAGGSSLHTKV